MELVDAMAQATMKAYALRHRPADLQRACAAMRASIKAGWPEFMDTIKTAREACMGDAMYREIMNTYANAWAVEAIKNS